MPRSLILGNGNIYVGLDRHAEVRDFYFPYVGLENHVGGHHVHKIGVWIDRKFSWLDSGEWDIRIDCGRETLSGDTTAVHKGLGVELHLNDIVYNEKNIFLRQVTVKNIASSRRKIKLFFHQQFEIYQSRIGDTAYYDPEDRVIIHYKGKRVFLVNLRIGDKRFDDYGIGEFEIEGKEGTHRDAEDGELSKNPIEHGRVDSAIGITVELDSGGTETLYYWIAAAQSIEDAKELNAYVLGRTPQHLIKTTQDFWYAWLNKQNFNFYGLEKDVTGLFKKSLLYIRANVDNHGGIIASGDSDMLQYGRDTYSYVWPRDAAFSSIALDKAGDSNVARKFFKFCNEVISNFGYFMHKYRPDRSLGSSWHPWVRDGKPELPIQEDETALVIYALWKHYELSKDLEFIEYLYNPLIKKAADFLAYYVDKNTGLPLPSYDLWEEKYGISTFACSATYAALLAAGHFAKILGKTDSEKNYNDVAQKLKDGILAHLWNDKEKMFYKLVNSSGGGFVADPTIDMSSIYGITRFGVLPVDDERVKDSMKTIESRLSIPTGIGGVARYEGDKYYRVDAKFPGNPWFISTLWRAQYYTALAKDEKDLQITRDVLRWVARYALPSGILSEQLNPYTGEQISAAPLTWSHSEFVTTVIQYLEKLEKLGISPTRYSVNEK